MTESPDYDRDAPTRDAASPSATGGSGPGPASTFVPASGVPIGGAGPGKTNAPDLPADPRRPARPLRRPGAPPCVCPPDHVPPRSTTSAADRVSTTIRRLPPCVDKTPPRRWPHSDAFCRIHRSRRRSAPRPHSVLAAATAVAACERGVPCVHFTVAGSLRTRFVRGDAATRPCPRTRPHNVVKSRYSEELGHPSRGSLRAIRSLGVVPDDDGSDIPGMTSPKRASRSDSFPQLRKARGSRSA